jgi:WD40 repeat protein
MKTKIVLTQQLPNRYRRAPIRLALLVFCAVSSVLLQSSTALGQKYSDWSTPLNLGAVINSAFSDQDAAMAKDGLSLYFASNRPGLGGFDMYVSQRANVDDPWGSPVNLGPTVNTAFDEGNAAFSRDGHYLFFQSKRPGGLGGVDIWASYREHTHDDFDWQTAVNLGAGVNSAADDTGPSYFANDENGGVPQLYFGSTRAGGLGGADIYRSEQLPDGSFGLPVLVTELSTSSNENRPTIRHDGLEILFHSNRVGSIGALFDLWVATRTSTFEAWSTPVSLGATINTAFQEQQPYVSSDDQILLFTSSRPGGFGGVDLYITTRTKVRGKSDN